MFLLLALVVYRIGAHIPVPGIDPDQLAKLFQSQSGGILGMFNMFSGGALSRFTIFALGVMPYISASIILQLMAIVSPQLEALKKEDPELFAKYEALKKASDAKPMSVEARRGRDLFFSEKANCTACHVGANFTDEKYHNIGVGMDKEKPDLGRFEVTKDEKDKGAFKTCKSPYKKTVKAGKHKLQIKATDAAGNVSSIKTIKWTVKKS